MQYRFNQKGLIHLVPLVITVAILGVICYLLIVTYAPFRTYISQSIYSTANSKALIGK